jgi:Hemingway/CFA97
VLDTRAPKQFNHLTNGTSSKTKVLMSKYRDMQNENRVLLKKMLSIDMKPSSLNPTKILEKQVPSHQSLNRISRLKELIRVNQENRVMFREINSLLSPFFPFSSGELKHFVGAAAAAADCLLHLRQVQVGERVQPQRLLHGHDPQELQYYSLQ